MESAIDISLDQFPPIGGEVPARRPIAISPSMRRAVVALILWAAASLLIGGITLHHHATVTQPDTGLCKRH